MTDHEPSCPALQKWRTKMSRFRITFDVTVDDPVSLVEEHGDPDEYEEHSKEEVMQSLRNIYYELEIDGVVTG